MTNLRFEFLEEVTIGLSHTKSKGLESLPWLLALGLLAWPAEHWTGLPKWAVKKIAKRGENSYKGVQTTYKQNKHKCKGNGLH